MTSSGASPGEEWRPGPTGPVGPAGRRGRPPAAHPASGGAVSRRPGGAPKLIASHAVPNRPRGGRGRGPTPALAGRGEKKRVGRGVDARSERPIIPRPPWWRALRRDGPRHRSLTIRSGSLCGRSRRRSISKNRRRGATRHAVACTSVESESGHVRVADNLQLKSLILAQIERWRHA